MQLATPQKRLGPRTFFLAVLTINLMSILSIDMYVPALPSMQRSFDVSIGYLNLTMFAFFLFSALGMLFAGPLSDKVGRKPLILGASVIFATSSLACALAPNVEMLVLFRVTQSIGNGAITALATALIQDAYTEKDLQMAMTTLQSLIIIGPAVAPFLGTLMLSLTDWRGIFLFLAACGVVAVALSLLISETHRPVRRAGGEARQEGLLAGMRVLGRDRSFMSLSVLMGAAGVPYFAFIATVSYILMDYFGASYLDYSLVYAATSCITIAAPYLYIALSKRMGTKRIVRLCIALVAASAVCMLAFGHSGPWLFFLAMVPYTIAEGIVRPMAFVVLLDQPEDRVGTASSFANFCYGILTSVATVLATFEWPTLILGLAVITCGTAAVMAALHVWGNAKKRGAAPS